MPIPKAPPGEEFAYDFQYMILLRESRRIFVFLDSYLYEPVSEPLTEDGRFYLTSEDMRRIYAPYLQIHEDGNIVRLCYRPAVGEAITATVEKDEIRTVAGTLYLSVSAVAYRCLRKPIWEEEDTFVAAVDGRQPVREVFPSQAAFLPYRNRIRGKAYGEQNYSLWMEDANRIIPYRVYVPCSYLEDTPQKAVVCFHGGDANADYMFRHTDNEICRYAEKQGYLLLALTSYRKYTFFGASKVPTGADAANASDPNPCGLTREELEWCCVAEESVLLQIRDAAKRYNLDFGRLYAMGNSGGCLGIFQQIKILPRHFFRAVVCSGGMPATAALDRNLLREKDTPIMLLMSTEDVFDGQRTLREGYPYLKSGNVPVSLCPVGGGSHLLGWTHALEDIFGFFREYS